MNYFKRPSDGMLFRYQIQRVSAGSWGGKSHESGFRLTVELMDLWPEAGDEWLHCVDCLRPTKPGARRALKTQMVRSVTGADGLRPNWRVAFRGTQSAYERRAIAVAAERRGLPVEEFLALSRRVKEGSK